MEDSLLGLLLLPDSRFRDATAPTVRAAAVDGFVIYSAASNDPRVEAALARNLPSVTVDQPPDPPTPFVGIDDRAGARTGRRAPARPRTPSASAVLSFVPRSMPKARSLSTSARNDSAGYKQGLGSAWDEPRRPHLPPERPLSPRAAPRSNSSTATRPRPRFSQ